MIYPNNFENKIGFNEIRIALKGRCLSSLGTEYVDNMAFDNQVERIVTRLLQVKEFRRILMIEDDFPNENFYDVRSPLLRIRPEGTYMEELELFDLKRSLETIWNITRFLNRTEDESSVPAYPTLQKLTDGIGSFPELIRHIDHIINKYGKMKDNASSELARIRNEEAATVRGISMSLRAILQNAQKEGYIDKDVSPTLRDGRLVIPVAPALKRKIKGIVHDESATGKTVFIEPAEVVEANNRIRELKGEEKREIIRILKETAQLIRPRIDEIIPSYHFLAEMDFIRAKALYADAIQAVDVVPQDKPLIDWVEAIHPLLQQSLNRNGKKMIPLDITLNSKQRILIISGPNAGGKSVCLKTVGLLQYMLQCGVPVPVKENSHTGIFESLFIDIGDEQSIEDDLSTYSSHLLNMKQMMKYCNVNSLLLIDEFGGGTEPQIGGAIAEAILKRFIARSTYGIITTHYQNLKHFADEHEGVINGAMLYDRHHMQALFQLQIGNPGSSFAVEIARKIGIPEEVIADASELVGSEYIQADKFLQDIVRDKRYWESKRQNIHQREKQLEQVIARYERDVQELQTSKKNILAKAKEEAQALLDESNSRIENTIRTIRETQAEKERTRESRQALESFKAELEKFAAQEEEDRIARKIEQIKQRKQRKEQRKQQQLVVAHVTPTVGKTAQPQIRTLQVGDYVRIKGQTAVGTVQEINEKTAIVLFGMMRTSVSQKRLEATEKPIERPVAFQAMGKETHDAIHERKLHFSQDIDVRGMRGNEALTAVTYFVDDAILVGMSHIRILHGTGTGALRSIIRDYLNTVPQVISAYDEHVQFGGSGITVVELD